MNTRSWKKIFLLSNIFLLSFGVSYANEGGKIGQGLQDLFLTALLFLCIIIGLLVLLFKKKK